MAFQAFTTSMTAASPVDIPAVEMASEALLEDACAASSPSSSDEDLDFMMTQSQFAQVVFRDVADSYPNDCPLLTTFTLTDLVEASPGDRVGIYRLPHIAPHAFAAFEWVKLGEDPTADSRDRKEMQVEFTGSALPKDEDMYIFQYIRSDSSVIGASIPFQLRSPKSEELCAVEDEEEFMVVKSNSALVAEKCKDRVQEMERKYSDLMSLSERLNEELELKSQSFIMLDEQCRSLLGERNRSEALKKDLAQVLQGKVDLEKKLHKALNDLDKMTTKMEAAITEQDFLRGKVQQAEQEKLLYQEEARQVMKKAEDLNHMLLALTKSKEMAVGEIRTHILKRDECVREVMELRQLLEKERAANSNAARSFDSLRESYELQRGQLKDLQEELVERTELHRAEMDLMKDHVALMRDQFEDSQKNKEDALDCKGEYETQIACLMSTIHELTEKVADLEEQLRESRRAAMDRGDNNRVEVERKQQQEAAVDYHSLYDSSQHKIIKLERMLRELEMGLRSSEQTHASEIRTLRDDLEQLRSRSYTASESSSTRNLDDYVIQNAMNELDMPIPLLGGKYAKLSDCVVRDVLPASYEEIPNANLDRLLSQNAAEFASMSILDSPEISATYQPLVKQPTGKSALKPRAKTPTSEESPFGAQSPQIACSPPSQSMSTAMCEVYKYFPPGYLLPHDGSHTIQMPQHQDPPMQQMQSAGNQPRHQQSINNNAADLSELAAWAASGQASMNSSFISANAASSSSSSEDRTARSNSFTLTDDGRPIAVGEDDDGQHDPEGSDLVDGARSAPEQLNCPLCEVEFGPGQVRELEFHVDSHLATSTNCPVCQQTFSLSEIDTFEAHVQGHFSQEIDFSMVEHEHVAMPSAPPAAAGSGGAGRQASSGPMGILGSVASTVSSAASSVTSTVTNPWRTWTLDID